ncbi:MAG: helix-turn-helix transcriptional regulator [Deltaproteobacteria bacterium]|nr:helix-turn-helix transcriptional regulator [Deltaproteobacteria bacterium]
MQFAEKLSKLRKEKGFTQQGLAQKIGVGISQIKRYEGRKSSPTLEIIKNIAKTLGVSSDELIFDKSESVASSKIFDRKLLEQFELISMMRPHEQFAIKTVIEGMIVKSRIDEVMPSPKDTSWSKEMEKVISKLRKGAEEYSDEEIDEIVDEAVRAVRAEKSYGEEQIEA